MLRFATPAALVAVILFGAGIRLYGRAAHPDLLRDEGISYLAATCHQGEFDAVVRGSLVGKWVPASEWTRLVRVEDRFCFRTIARDLIKTDKHPPLYFWVLHLWLLAFPVAPWTGLALNLLFFAFGALFLYGVAKELLADTPSAFVVMIAWAWSPWVALVAYEARPYELLALLTCAMLWVAQRWSNPAVAMGVARTASLAVMAVAGALTHYHFAIVLVAVSVWGLARLGRNHFKRWLIGNGAMLGGVGAAFVVHPIASVLRGRVPRRLGQTSMDPEGWRSGIARASDVFEAFFDPLVRAPTGVVLLALVLALVAWSLYRRWQAVGNVSLRPAWRGASVLVVAAISVGVLVAAFASGITPRHAMGPKYASLAWPTLAFVPVLVARLLPRGRLLVMVGVAALYLVAAVSGTPFRGDPRRRFQTQWLDASYVTLGDDHRLRLPRILLRVRDSASIFHATPQSVSRHLDAWETPWRRSQLVLSSKLARQQQTKDLLALLADRGMRIRRRSSGGFVTWTLVRVNRSGR